jgi:hypothetical protein
MTILWLSGWYLLGVIGCIFGVTADLKNGKDFTVSGLLGCTLASCTGLFVLVVGLSEYFKGVPDKVLIHGDKE